MRDTIRIRKYREGYGKGIVTLDVSVRRSASSQSR